MKRFLGVAAAAVLAAAILTVSTPASADVDVCAGNGTAETATPVFYPLPGAPSASGGFTVQLVGACAVSGGITFNGGSFTTRIRVNAGNTNLVDENGPIGNYCGHSTGTATLNGHTGDWVSAASMLVFTGGMTGVVNAIPDAANGELCSSGADHFIVTGALAGTDI